MEGVGHYRMVEKPRDPTQYRRGGADMNKYDHINIHEDPTQPTGSDREVLSALLKQIYERVHPVDFYALTFSKTVREALNKDDQLSSSTDIDTTEVTKEVASKAAEDKDLSSGPDEITQSHTTDQVADKVKIKQKEYKVLFVECLVELTKVLGYPISDYQAETRIYSGKHWLTFEQDVLQHFLRVTALRMGVPPLIAKDADFIQSCYKQLQMGTYQPIKENKGTLLNFQNGTLVFSPDGRIELKEHSPADLLRYVLPYEYRPDAKCPKFQEFLDRVIPEQDKQQVLAEFIGSCFSPIKHEKVLLLYGGGANGKSVVMDISNALLGDENVSSHTLESLTDKSGYYRGQLADYLLNYSGEISTQLNSDAFKKLASGEKITARFAYGRPFQIADYARLAFNCNKLPEANDLSEGYYRRFLIIPFEQYIPKRERNPNLANEITAEELPGIMNWVIEGLERLTENKSFSPCASADLMLEQYKKQTNTVLEFIESEFYQQLVLPLKATQIYERYREYCKGQGFNTAGPKAFYQRLKACGVRKSRRSDGSYYG